MVRRARSRHQQNQAYPHVQLSKVHGNPRSRCQHAQVAGLLHCSRLRTPGQRSKTGPVLPCPCSRAGSYEHAAWDPSIAPDFPPAFPPHPYRGQVVREVSSQAADLATDAADNAFASTQRQPLALNMCSRTVAEWLVWPTFLLTSPRRSCRTARKPPCPPYVPQQGCLVQACVTRSSTAPSHGGLLEEAVLGSLASHRSLWTCEASSVSTAGRWVRMTVGCRPLPRSSKRMQPV